MAEKKINYMSRTYDEVRGDLIKLSNKYYPELSDSFNDSSVGAWFIDLMAAVTDDLNYHIDRTYQETNINSSNMKGSVLNLARSSGLKVPGNKASICEVELSCELPSGYDGNLSLPNWNYSPVVKRSSVVSSGPFNYELTEDVNFGEQFNSDGVSNRKFSPKRDSNGVITGYTVTKSTIVIGGISRVYKKIITDEELQPFMEIILPEKNIMNVESIIFKDTSNFSNDPKISEYFIDKEEYRLNGESVNTYRYFEVNSLADQYRFGTDIEDNSKGYDDYTETDKDGKQIRSTRVYRGKWKPLTQKFITEYTDNGYLKVIFGSGVLYDETPNGTTYAENQMSKLINNDMLGLLPNSNWTMYVLYRVGGGIETNVAQGAINSISFLNSEMPKDGVNKTIVGNVMKSISVINVSTSVAGKNAPSIEEVKNLVKYNTSSQNRCVTVKDYKVRLMTMPPKYGCPFRSSVIEENNKISMHLLGMNANGKLTTFLPQTLVNNIIEYLGYYRSINDYVEIKSGRIYNLAFELDLFIDKNYNTAEVLKSVITSITNYMDVNTRDIGEDIFIGDLEKTISMMDGVISIIKLRVYNIYEGKYSSDKCPLPMAQEFGDGCQPKNNKIFNTPDGSNSFEIGLGETENVLYSDYNSMFEILNPESDIVIRVKLK